MLNSFYSDINFPPPFFLTQSSTTSSLRRSVIRVLVFEFRFMCIFAISRNRIRLYETLLEGRNRNVTNAVSHKLLNRLSLLLFSHTWNSKIFCRDESWFLIFDTSQKFWSIKEFQIRHVDRSLQFSCLESLNHFNSLTKSLISSD